MRKAAVLMVAVFLIAGCQAAPLLAKEQVVAAPAAERQSAEPKGLKYAVFAGGCFWGVEGVFSHLKGVTSAVSGYHGGSAADAKYKIVSGGETGHAEAVRVTYDPEVIRYDQLLRVFFSVATDPTQRNRQGPDIGTQYRSALVPLSEEQRRVATAYLAQMEASGLWPARIATRIEAYKKFYPAEASHQDFMAANPDHPYIQRWDAPKVAALKRLYPTLYSAAFTKG